MWRALLLAALPCTLLAGATTTANKTREERPRWGLIKYAGIKRTPTPAPPPVLRRPLPPLGQRSMKTFMLSE
jgi:hypothetical protein